jgi:hypothetical protein
MRRHLSLRKVQAPSLFPLHACVEFGNRENGTQNFRTMPNAYEAWNRLEFTIRKLIIRKFVEKRKIVKIDLLMSDSD